MTPEETKAALRNFINATIKGDPEGNAQSIISNVLQSKMKARIMGTAGPETIDTATPVVDDTAGAE
jgi:hypothetical protein